MPLPFIRVALIGKHQSASSHGMLERIATFLSERCGEVLLESATAARTGLTTWGAHALDDLGRSCDLAVVVGGDGTMLGCARALAPHRTALVGVNQGRLGFMTDTPLDKVYEALERILAGDFAEEHRSMLQGRVMRDGHCIAEGLALNEVAVHRPTPSGVVEIAMDQAGAHIGTVLGDGLIVSTPTGSTAYGLAAGGPILHPGLQAWIVVWIAGRALYDRPLVLPQTGEIHLTMCRHATVTFDGQIRSPARPGDRVVVSKAEHEARFIHPRGWSYFETLRNKMHWNEAGA